MNNHMLIAAGLDSGQFNVSLPQPAVAMIAS